MKFGTQTSGKAKITWQQTSANSAAGLTAANIISSSADPAQNAIGCLITVETQDIRFTLDGDTAPTTTGVGHLLTASAMMTLDDPGQIQNFSFISKTAGSHATITITSFFAKL